MKFWQWLGMVIVLLIIGGLLVRITYILRTGRDVGDRRLDRQRGIVQGAGETSATE